MLVVHLLSLAILTPPVLSLVVKPVKRSCSSGFKNIVFNSGVNSQPDIVGRWENIQSYGVTSWIGFTCDDPSPADPTLMAGQIRMVVTSDNIQDGLNLVTGANPPPYLQLLNEPDIGMYGQPVISPQDAATALAPFFTAQTTTQFIAPAPAMSWTSWLTDFFAACNGCQDLFPIIPVHVYNDDPNETISLIQGVQSQFPNQKIWVTELSPASNVTQGCTLDDAGVISWMQTVVGWASSQPQIERVFWNGGEASDGLGDGGASCKTALTNMDGSATDLLQAYQEL